MKSKDYCPLIKERCKEINAIFIGVTAAIALGESSPIVSGACAILNIYASLSEILEILERLDRKKLRR